MATTPPGWYDDERGALRWWDGTQWTEHVQIPDAETEDSADADAAATGAPERSAASAAQEEAMDTLLAPALDMTADTGSVPPAAPTLRDASRSASAEPGSFAAASDEDAATMTPPGYPGGFPGGTSPSGAFIAATEPKKSRLWILWVVLGVVLLGVVILAAVFIPVLVGLFGSTAAAETEDETAAVAVVEQYDQAWATNDCEMFVAATTEQFRQVLQLADCTAFSAASQGFIDSVQNYELNVTSIETGEDQITVETTETYSSLVDPQGNPTDEPVPYEDHYAYQVVPAGDGWAINEAIANE